MRPGDCLTCWYCGRIFWSEETGGCASTRPQPVAVLILPGMGQVMTFRCSRCESREWRAQDKAVGVRNSYL